MRLFFAPPENISKDKVILRGSDVSHIRNVLRMKCGQSLYVVDGSGSRFKVEIESMDRSGIKGRILLKEAFATESPLKIFLGQSLLRGNKFDTILRKSVELGVNEVAPIFAERSVVKISNPDSLKKVERWNKISWEASKQSGRSQIPKVKPIFNSIEEFSRACEDFDLKIVFWEEEETVRLRDIELKNTPRSVAVVTGPEGGLTGAEIKVAREAGFCTVSLGSRILRAETAPIAVLSLLQNLWGDL